MKKRFLGVIIVWMALATTAQADWSRDITYQTGGDPVTPNNHKYLGIQGIHDGPVVADVIPAWSGKEILQAKRTSILIIGADNQQTPLELTIPSIQVPGEYCQVGEGPFEFVAGQPAVGDVDNDGDNDIVVGITYQCEQLFGDTWVLYYFGSVVWWTWNGTSFDQHSLRLEDAGEFTTPAFLGTPAICKTQWTEGGTTVVFWGPNSLQVTDSRDSYYVLTAFDLSDPQQPTVSQASAGGWVTVSQLTWARGSGIYVQAADLNGDGYDELMAHNDTTVYRFDWNGSNFVETRLYPVPNGNAFQSGHGAIADVDADGNLEYLVSYSTIASPPTNGHLAQINLVGTLDWAYGFDEPNTNPIVGTQPGMCDLSRHPSSPPETPEGRLSPITATRHDSRMYNSATGELRSDAWAIGQLDNWGDQRNVSNPALAHVTGAVVQPQFIKVDIGLPNVGENQIRVYDPITGTLVYSEDLTVQSLYTADEYSAVTSSPVYCDLDGSGEGSIVTSFRTAANTLRIFRTDPGHAFSPELAEWSQIENGPAHKGLYAQPVTGNQPRDEMVWDGRIIVHGTYYVGVNQTLTIKPGTVVEFRPDAILHVKGTLIAHGSGMDSIYFKADGTSAWDGIVLYDAQFASLFRCNIHGGGSVYAEGDEVFINNCRIYDMIVGVDAWSCKR